MGRVSSDAQHPEIKVIPQREPSEQPALFRACFPPESTPPLALYPAILLSTFGAASGAQEETHRSTHVPGEEGTNVSWVHPSLQR